MKWLMFVALVAIVLVFVARRSRRRATKTTASQVGLGLGFAVGVMLTLLIGYAWITSLFQTTETVLTTGSRRRVASHHGGLQYLFVRDWPEPRGLVTATFERDLGSDLVWEWAKPDLASAAMTPAVLSLRTQLSAAQMKLAQLQALVQRRQQIAAIEQSDEMKLQTDATLVQLQLQLRQAQLLYNRMQAFAPAITAQSMSIGGPMPGSPAAGSAPASPFIRNRTPSSVHYWLGLTYVCGQLTAPDGSARSYTAVRVAYPWLFALPAAVTLLTLRARLRRRRRIARGLCANCGYDLRASRNRCPECGTPMPQSNVMLVMDSPDAPA
jgi:hypothetical protein